MSRLGKLVMVFCIVFATAGSIRGDLSLDTYVIVISMFTAMGILDETLKRR